MLGQETADLGPASPPGPARALLSELRRRPRASLGKPWGAHAWFLLTPKFKAC